MRTHSEIAGPWIPEEVVIGMLVWVKRGWETKRSTPAERRWIRFKLLGLSGMAQVRRMVDDRQHRVNHIKTNGGAKNGLGRTYLGASSGFEGNEPKVTRMVMSLNRSEHECQAWHDFDRPWGFPSSSSFN